MTELHSICVTLILNVAPVVVVAKVKAKVVEDVDLAASTYTEKYKEMTL